MTNIVVDKFILLFWEFYKFSFFVGNLPSMLKMKEVDSLMNWIMNKAIEIIDFQNIHVEVIFTRESK